MMEGVLCSNGVKTGELRETDLFPQKQGLGPSMVQPRAILFSIENLSSHQNTESVLSISDKSFI